MSRGNTHKKAQSVKAWVGLGGNLGDVKQTFSQAIAMLSACESITDVIVSSLYKTAPIDAQGDDFINAVTCFYTTYPPLELLHYLQFIEQKLGRERPYWHAPRTLDLDLLLYDALELNLPELILPHHAMHERAFVLAPLAELDEDLMIPTHGAVKTLLECVKHQKVERLSSTFKPIL